MAGRGRTPKKPEERLGKGGPPIHEWKAAPGVGWQHGELPVAPDGLMPASLEAWRTWFTSWFAAYWTPDLLPGLRQVVRLYDQVERGEFQRASELRLAMDTYGMTPKGQQDRRWQAPAAPNGQPQGVGGAPTASDRKTEALRLLRGEAG